jgi:hypothetical protein
MARAKITYTYNPQTGKREWHIDYQSPSDATMDEHEAKHRALVREMVGDLESPDVEVDRGLARKPEAKPVPTDPQPPLPKSKLQ